MKKDIPEDDAEGKAFSKSVGTLVRSGGIDAAHLGKEPSSGSVDSLLMFLRSSGHRIFITKIFY